MKYKIDRSIIMEIIDLVINSQKIDRESLMNFGETAHEKSIHEVLKEEEQIVSGKLSVSDKNLIDKN